MKISPISVLLLVAAIALTSGVSACGRKGDPIVPKEQHKDTFPDQYPRSTKPQSGVFSG